MNQYLAALKGELKKNEKTPCSGTDKTDKRALVSKVSTHVGRFSEKKMPSWCCRECQNLIELHTPKGTFPGCRVEAANQISWMRLSFLKGCPEEMGESAMPFFPTREDFKGG